MALYDIEIAGQKFTVDAGSPEEAARAAQRFVDDQDDNAAVNLARSALGQGVAFNFGDEIEAAARAPFSKRTRKELLKDIRGEIDEFRRDRPALAFGSELAGAALPAVASMVATPFTAGASAPAAAATGARAASLAAKLSSPTARAIGLNAVSGALSGAGVADENKLAGAAGGALAGGLIGAGARALPKLTPQARQMIEEGQTLTPGQATQPMPTKVGAGEPRLGILNLIEQQGTSLPVVGSAIGKARNRPNSERFATVADRALLHVGKRLDRDIKDPQQIMDNVRSAVSEAFDDVARSNPIKDAGAQAFGEAAFDTLEFADEALVGRLQRSLNDIFKGLRAPKGEQLRRAFNVVTKGTREKITPISITGDEMLNIVNKLRAKARQARGSGDRDVANLFEDLANNFVSRGAAGSGVKQALTQARTAYREYKILRDAFDKTAFDQAATAGGLLRARKKNLANPRFGRNEKIAELEPADTAAYRILRNSVANSGTPERALTIAGLGTLGGVAAGAVNPAVLAPAVLPGVLGAMYATPQTTALLRQGVLAPGRLGQAFAGRFGGYTQEDQN